MVLLLARLRAVSALHYPGRVRCHGRREVIWAIAALGCPHECWECLALVATELHAMCWKDICRVGWRIAGDFVEDELRKMLVDGTPEELQSFGDCSPEGESGQAGFFMVPGATEGVGVLTSWSRRGRRPQTLVEAMGVPSASELSGTSTRIYRH